MGILVGRAYPHQSGVSIYAADWRTRFPSIATVLAAPDVPLWGPGKGQPWDVYCRAETTPQMAVTKLIFQVWKERDVKATALASIPAEACIFHQDKNGALIRQIAALRHPEFMANLETAKKFYLLNGPSSRLKLKGLDVHFSYEKHAPGSGWRSAVASDELTAAQAQTMALTVGKLGLREITEADFVKITGRGQKSTQPVIPRRVVPGRGRPVPPVARPLKLEVVPDGQRWSHPNVFVMLGRYGDIINILPMLFAEYIQLNQVDDHERNFEMGKKPGVPLKPTLVVSQDFADILDGVSYCDRIVWEGGYDRLPDALRWLRRDKGIPLPRVVQFYRHPTEKARKCESYQLEAWRMGGFDWETRAALVFDRTNNARAHELVKKHVTGDLPVILVGLTSHSSPLKTVDGVMAAVIACFQRTHLVIDLSRVVAERVYDLIPLYESAACLLAADTMHLHLARASTVPLVALLNDGWNGSVVEHAAEAIRYADVTPQGVVDAITRTLAAGPRSKERSTPVQTFVPQPISGPRIFHVVHMHGQDERHRIAQATWPAAYAEGITPVHCREYVRDAHTEIKDPRSLPYLKDLLKAAMDQSTDEADIVAWGNSDCGLAPGAAEAIRSHVSVHQCATMRRTESNGKHHPGRDLFAFTVGWLREHWDEIPDYIIGAPIFDLGIVALVRKHHGLPALTMKTLSEDLYPAEMAPGYCLHESHDPEWQVRNIGAVPSVKWNRTKFIEWAKIHAPEMRFSKTGNLL